MAIDLGCDESGNGDRLLVSVQVGIYEQAKKFKKEWKKRLWPVEYFHGVDFDNHSHGVFSRAGLKRPERLRLANDLANLIHQRLLCGVTVRLNISEYNRLTTQAFRSRFGTAYGFAVDMCLLGAYAAVTEMGLKPHFNVLIEKGHRNANQVAQILDGLRRIPDEIMAAFPGEVIPDIKILTSGLGDKTDHPILQSADMLAYGDWQQYVPNGGDLTIFNALHKQGMRYVALKAYCDEELIKEYVAAGAKPFIKEFNRRANAVIAKAQGQK